ncbi:hypothetical protein ACFL3D_01935 [Candidatus Omnitrophota bacterium]
MWPVNNPNQPCETNPRKKFTAVVEITSTMPVFAYDEDEAEDKLYRALNLIYPDSDIYICDVEEV